MGARICWCPWQDSNLHLTRFERAALPVGLHGHWCAERDLNSHCSRSERDASCQLGYRRVVIRIGARCIDSNAHLSRYKPEALPVELNGHDAGKLPPASFVIIFLAETRAVGRAYGSRGALMLRERRPARFIHSEPKMRSKSSSTRTTMSRAMSGLAISV